jgi:hypothetical protein
MALTYDQISAITQKKFIPKLYDNVFDSNPLLQRGKKKFYEKVDGGERIIVPLNYAMVTSSGWYQGSETLSTADNENMTAAEYTWKQLYANISINRLDEIKNSGDSQILNLVKQKTKIAEKTMEDKLGTGIYSAGTDPKSIVGLRNIAASITATVGGISQSSYSWWQPQLDSATTTLTIAAMQSRDNACTVNSDSPTVIATTRSLYNSYYALLQPQQRFMDSETAKGGFSSLMFNGKPVIADSYCPASHMLFLNENYLHLFVHKDEDMRFEPFQKPINQNVKVAKIFWAGAFGSSNNRMHGALNAVTA